MSGSTIARAEFVWNGGQVRRYHTVRPLQEDTVGHHSYNVAALLLALWPDDVSAALLRAALLHDVAEHRVGDLPAPTKRMLPDYRLNTGDYESFREAFGKLEAAFAKGVGFEPEQLTPTEEWQLKFADAMDGLRFCVRERELGNRTKEFEEVFNNFSSYVVEALNRIPTDSVHLHAPALAIYQHLDSKWNKI